MSRNYCVTPLGSTFRGRDQDGLGPTYVYRLRTDKLLTVHSLIQMQSWPDALFEQIGSAAMDLDRIAHIRQQINVLQHLITE